MERYLWIPTSEAGEYCSLEVVYKPDEAKREDFWRQILDCQLLEVEYVEGSAYVALLDGEAIQNNDMNYKASHLLRGIVSSDKAQLEGYYGPVIVGRRRWNGQGESFIGWLEEEDVERLKRGHLRG